MTKAPPTSSTAALDPQLARLIDDITAKLQSGQQVDVSAILHSHPEYADELREILPTLAALGDLSQSAQNGLINSPFGQDDSAGTLGDFRLVRELGRGGMGVVYEALQISLNRRVALKVLPFAATMDPKHLQRFRNEAMAAASLRHENIVHVYGVGCERSVHFYAMELIDGQTLAQIIAGLHKQLQRSDVTSDYKPAGAGSPTAPVGALSTEFNGIKGRELHRLAARLMADAAEALEHAHSLGIVHRDIKPGNLMVDAGGKVYVTDFGLARFGTDAGLTMSGDLLGTLRYMSPEQAMARHGLVDHRTDIYSLGATLYELLTGRPAVVGEDKQEVLKHIAFEEPIALRKIERSIPVELETITLKALAKNPNERYATAKELAEDLRRWMDDKAIKARRPTLPQRVVRWARRHPVWTAAAALVAGMLIAGTWAWHRETTNAERAALAVAEESDQLRNSNRLPEALQAARRASDMLPRFGIDKELKQTIAERVANLELLNRLDEIRLKMAVERHDGFGFDRQRALPLLRRAFQDYGVDVLSIEEQATVEAFGSRGVGPEIAAVLIEWWFFAQDATEKDRLARLIEALDVDPRQFLAQVRRAASANQDQKIEMIKRLAAEAEANLPPPAILGPLAKMLIDCSCLDQAEKLLRAGQQRYPADFWTNYYLAYAISEMGPARAAEAVRFYTAAVALRPNSWTVWNYLGSSLLETARPVEAEAAYQRALTLNPDYAGAHHNLGRLRSSQGRLQEAEAGYQRAIKLSPNDARHHYGLGTLLSEHDRLGEAEALLRRTVALSPDYAMAHCNLGVVFARTGRAVEAEAAFRRALEIQPKLIQGHANLGAILKMMGRMPEAEASLRQAIALQPGFLPAYQNLNDLLAKQGRPVEPPPAKIDDISPESIKRVKNPDPAAKPPP